MHRGGREDAAEPDPHPRHRHSLAAASAAGDLLAALGVVGAQPRSGRSKRRPSGTAGRGPVRRRTGAAGRYRSHSPLHRRSARPVGRSPSHADTGLHATPWPAAGGRREVAGCAGRPDRTHRRSLHTSQRAGRAAAPQNARRRHHRGMGGHRPVRMRTPVPAEPHAAAAIGTGSPASAAARRGRAGEGPCRPRRPRGRVAAITAARNLVAAMAAVHADGARTSAFRCGRHRARAARRRGCSRTGSRSRLVARTARRGANRLRSLPAAATAAWRPRCRAAGMGQIYGSPAVAAALRIEPPDASSAESSPIDEAQEMGLAQLRPLRQPWTFPACGLPAATRADVWDPTWLAGFAAAFGEAFGEDGQTP